MELVSSSFSPLGRAAWSSSSPRLPTPRRSSGGQICAEEEGMVTITTESIRREEEGWIRRNAEGGYAPGAFAQDRQGHRRCFAKEVQQRQAQLSRSFEVYASRRY